MVILAVFKQLNIHISVFLRLDLSKVAKFREINSYENVIFTNYFHQKRNQDLGPSNALKQPQLDWQESRISREKRGAGNCGKNSAKFGQKLVKGLFLR